MKGADASAPIAATADMATVVFLRPSGLGFAVNFAILDQKGTWMGDAVAQSHFAVQLPPGEYMFVGWAENTAALKATLAPRRVYYVKVDPSMGFGSARVTLEALTPRHAEWSEVTTWTRGTSRLEPLPDGRLYIQERRDDAMERVQSAIENWKEYSETERQQRTLHAEDGT